MAPKKTRHTLSTNAKQNGKPVKGFTDEERAAMQERAREMKAEQRRSARASNTEVGQAITVDGGMTVV